MVCFVQAQTELFEITPREGRTRKLVKNATVYIVNDITTDSLILTEYTSGKAGTYYRNDTKYGKYKVYVNGTKVKDAHPFGVMQQVSDTLELKRAGSDYSKLILLQLSSGNSYGGGTFVLRSAAFCQAILGDSSANSVTIFTSATAGTRWVRQAFIDNGRKLNLWWAGGIGDGTTNDSTAFARAWAATDSCEKGSIFIPEGNFVLGKQFDANWKPLKLEGVDRQKSIIDCEISATAHAFIKVGSHTNIRNIYFTNTISTSGLIIRTLEAAPNDLEYITIKNNTFDCSSRSIKFSRVNSSIISDNFFINSSGNRGNAITLKECDSIIVKGNHFEQQAAESGNISPINTQNLIHSVISNNIIESSYEHGILLEDNSDYNTVTGNVIKIVNGSNGHGIFLQGGYNNVFTGNTIQGPGDVDGGDDTGIRVQLRSIQTNGHNVIGNNKIYDFSHGLYFVAPGTDSVDNDTYDVGPFICWSNEFENVHTGMRFVSNATAPEHDSLMFLIKGNTFTNVTQNVLIDNSRARTIFELNTVYKSLHTTIASVGYGGNKWFRFNTVLSSPSMTDLVTLTSMSGYTVVEEHNIVSPNTITNSLPQPHKGFILTSGDSLIFDGGGGNDYLKFDGTNKIYWYVNGAIVDSLSP